MSDPASGTPGDRRAARRRGDAGARGVLGGSWVLLGACALLFAPAAWGQGPTETPEDQAAPAGGAPDSSAPDSSGEGPSPSAPPNEAANEPESTPAEDADGAGDAPTPPPVRGADDPRARAGSADADVPPELAEAMAEFERFAGEERELRAATSRILSHQYERKRREIQARYRGVVDELSIEERRRRQDAIGRFEEFIERYPDNPSHTPDALFRLAELHFEKSNDQYVTALEEYDEIYAAYNPASGGEPPPEPRQDYRRSIELFDRLIRRWPDYRNVDGAHYLKGYCLLEMGEDQGALEQFTALVQRHPNSRFVPETWTRIGEYYFDYNRLPEAIDAYSRVLAFKDSPYYDKALYKLAWTYYRNDQYPESIARFRELIEYSDDVVLKTGGGGSELRSEAIEYLAISLQEDDWDGDGVPDADSGFDRVLQYVKADKPYDVEILEALARIYFDNAKYPESIATTRYLLEKFPRNERNPELHANLILSYERLQQVDEAFAERDTLARTYGPDSTWYRANEDKPKVLAEADRMIEEALIQAATYHHARAQDLRRRATEGDVAAEEEAIRSYRKAAVAYDNYLKRYPDSENTYKLSYLYAECLFYSFRFLDAAEQYVVVRDSKLGTEFREPAAFSAILARENVVRELITDGRVGMKPSLMDASSDVEKSQVTEEDNDGTVKEIVAEPIPDPVEALLAERRFYVENNLVAVDDAGRTPRIIYKIGETYFDYRHFDEARKWFEKLIGRYPNEEVASFAAGRIIESYRQANDWAAMEQAAGELANLITDKTLKEEITRFKLGAQFKTAERFFAQERYDEAAAEYIRLVDADPAYKYADRALNNAAVAFEKTRRFESATKTYERLLRDYPRSEFIEDAITRVAINAERFYDYDKAISNHMKLVAEFPNSPRRAEALLDAADLQEQTQNYREAAGSYERFAQLFPTHEKSPEVFFRSARVYRKLEDERNEVRIYETFVQRYGNDPNQSALVVRSLSEVADVHKKRGRIREAKAMWQRVISEFNRRGLQPATFEAQYPAKAQFELVEQDFKVYEALKLRGTLPQQGKTIQVMQQSVRDLSRRYADVIPYRSFEWTLATFYRLGHLYQLFAEALYDAPIPETLDEEAEDMYRTQLEDIAVPIEDEAVKRYEQAFEKAREFRVTNEWTKRIVQALNKYKPGDYPLFKEERRLPAARVVSASRLLSIAPKAPPPPPEDEEGEGENEGQDGAEDAPAGGGEGEQ